MTRCDKDFFPLNTVTRCDFKHFGGKFISRKNRNICLPFENKCQHKGKISLEYLENVSNVCGLLLLRKFCESEQL